MNGMFWEMYQQNRIRDTESRASDTRNDLATTDRELRRRIDGLMLINMAMWSILEEKLGVSEQQLAERVKEIDLRDGKLDGRIATEGAQCPRCSRIMSVRHNRCMYCGEDAPKKKVFI